ncbi:MrcB family domain-containing protein [Methanobacterium oryzae]|uniref:MrcB family domain-containing protein n=1 Tax=Methanobacterium oryzae TaxID=69540 RepID=UPI003D1D68A9
MLKELFERVLKQYKSAKNENFTGHPIANILRNEIPTELKEIIGNSDKYKVSGSAGQGNWTYSPWVAILNKEITESPQSGYYLVYLFREDMRGVYLSLNQGMTDLKNQHGTNKTNEILKSKSKEYREKLGEQNEFLNSINLGAINSSSASFYEEGNIYAKYYDLSNFPSDDAFKNDLKIFLGLYDSLVYGPLTDSKDINIWKISPGNAEESEKYWPLYKEHGYIGIDWMESTKDFREFKTIQELNDALEDHYGKPKTTSAQGIWNFVHNVKIGDYIVTNRGKKKILGIGIIKSDYIGPNDQNNPNLDKEYRHLRKVDWIILDEFEMDTENFFDIKTITQLSGSKWNEILIKYYKNSGFNLIKELFNEFNRDYFSTEIGKSHYRAYQEESRVIKDYFNKIRDDSNIVENIDDPILNYIVPIKRPSVSTVGFKSFKAFGYTDEQIPALTMAIFNLINDLANIKDKERQENRIKSFKSSNYSKGSQTGVISPLLHGLNSDFLIINSKTIDTVNFISKILDMPIKLNTDLSKYIDNNEKLKDFLNIISKQVVEFTDFHIFDAFCHWICDKSLAAYATGNPLPLFNISLFRPPKIINNNYHSFVEFLNEKGFYFEPEMIENFLLSLKVKPFVILTGNSGTGKTKIAQLFAQYISSPKNESTLINTEVKVGKSAKNKGWTLKRNVLDELDVPNYNGSYDIKIDGIQSKGNFYMLSQLFYEDKDNKIKSRLEEIAKENLDQKVSLEILLPANNNSQYKIVPVGANWTENRHIIGFYNVITDEYITSNALDLIMEASKPENTDKPFFLVLDEMNLSHVERYFADFLSAMESNEKISLHKSNIEDKYPNNLKIPQNLFVIGTVNVDETTYMFSPKVLDRANVIEFSTIPVEKYMLDSINQEELNGDFEYLENPLSDHNLYLNLRNTRINDLREYLDSVKTKDGRILWNVLSEELNKFQEVLKKAGFDFGFRVIDEILRFMYVSWSYEGEPDIWENWERYFDAQIKQKMLPKIHGSQRTLENVIKELFRLCCNGESEKSPRKFGDILSNNNVRYPTSALKLQEMDKVLYEQRYVAFIN